MSLVRKMEKLQRSYQSYVYSNFLIDIHKFKRIARLHSIGGLLVCIVCDYGFLYSILSTLTSSPSSWYTYVTTVPLWISISTKEGVTDLWKDCPNFSNYKFKECAIDQIHNKLFGESNPSTESSDEPWLISLRTGVTAPVQYFGTTERAHSIERRYMT